VQQARATYLQLPQTWEIMAGHFSASFRRQIARSERELARLGKVRFHRAKVREEILPALDVLAELHQQRWTSRDRPGCFASERFTRFHKEFLAEAAPHGWAEVALLSIDDTPVAALYLFRFRGTMHFYQSGVLTAASSRQLAAGSGQLTTNKLAASSRRLAADEAAGSRQPAAGSWQGTDRSGQQANSKFEIRNSKLASSSFRPGIVLHAQAIRWAIDEGFTEYDFMKGASAFKRRWSPAERILDTATLTRGAGRAWAANRLSAGLRTIRRTVTGVLPRDRS
jgi:CelD/BcsL family acetyltransferase involved in cellulose biosynthesis